MKETYESPELEVIRFTTADVIEDSEDDTEPVDA